MKHSYLFFASAMVIVLLYACGSNGANNVNADKSNAIASVNSNFSCTIDGVHVSGGETGELQLSNTAFHYTGNNGTSKFLLFDLLSEKKGDDFYTMRFYIPEKVGPVLINEKTEDDCGCYIRLDFNLRSADNFAIYNIKEVNVKIDKITASGVSGTFSGTFKLSDDSRNKPYKSEISVSDGKFDIPFSTGNLRPI
ncbi:MAG TPA: hypothetical protein VMT76_02005 [Puia sp.]|nr:hypothetical protein [Puia sp.]